MNRKFLIGAMIVIFAIISGFIAFKIVSKNEEKTKLNENTKNMVEISAEYSNENSNINANEHLNEDTKLNTTANEEAVTDECLDEWDDYNEYISGRVEEASNNFSENDTHYLLKDVYGYIEVYYLDENNDEFLYKKTGISTC